MPFAWQLALHVTAKRLNLVNRQTMTGSQPVRDFSQSRRGE
jgi:hypothetical protein